MLQGSVAVLPLLLDQKPKKFVMLFGTVRDAQVKEYGAQAFTPNADAKFEQLLQQLHGHELPKVPPIAGGQQSLPGGGHGGVRARKGRSGCHQSHRLTVI